MLSCMAKQFFIGANWKMHSPPTGALEKDSPYCSRGGVQVVVFPSFVDLENCIRTGELVVGAQCGRAEPDGAFTGDVSMNMLSAVGCTHVLCGHSERRLHHGEKNADIAAQVQSAMDSGLLPVVCIGETEAERLAGQTEAALRANIEIVLQGIKPDAEIIVAYEPVWAIGTGKTPTPEEVQTTHAFIRPLLPNPKTRIIYGGSVTGQNAAEFFRQPDIDGVLVGGASLRTEEFAAIVAATKYSGK